MARVTIVFGFALILLGVSYFWATGGHAPTALIPAVFGLVLAVCGVAANTANVKRHALWMHVAVTIGLIGFIATAKAIFQYVELQQGIALPRPAAIQEKAAMSALCLIFTLLCVRSFIAARRARRASNI